MSVAQVNYHQIQLFSLFEGVLNLLHPKCGGPIDWKKTGTGLDRTRKKQ